MKHTVYIKYLSNSSDAISVISELSENANAEELVFDFSQLSFAKTIATALVAREMRWVVANRKSKDLNTFYKGHKQVTIPAISYLNFIGFFDFIGVENCSCKVRSSAEAHDSYIAITRYDYRRFKSNEEVDHYRTAYDYINDEAGTISKLLTNDSTKNRILQYAICEIMRNAYEHSQSVDFYAFGQYWSNGNVELVLMDDGVGLKKTLLTKYPLINSEEMAIKEAIKPGVSGSNFNNNKYNNSGFGLYVLTEFAKKHGQMYIASKDCLLQLSLNNELANNVCSAGTLVGIHLSRIPDDYRREIEKIISEGDIISSKSRYPIRPSKNTFNF